MIKKAGGYSSVEQYFSAVISHQERLGTGCTPKGGQGAKEFVCSVKRAMVGSQLKQAFDIMDLATAIDVEDDGPFHVAPTADLVLLASWLMLREMDRTHVDIVGLILAVNTLCITLARAMAAPFGRLGPSRPSLRHWLTRASPTLSWTSRVWCCPCLGAVWPTQRGRNDRRALPGRGRAPRSR